MHTSARDLHFHYNAWFLSEKERGKMDYSKYEVEELTQILDSLAFIQECVTFTTSETGLPKGNDFLWSGLVLKENIKAVSQALRMKTNEISK